MEDGELNNYGFEPNDGAENFSDENVEQFCAASKAEANAVLEDEAKMERLFQRLERKLKAVPIAGNSLAYVPIMMSMVRSYVKKEYTELPLGTIASVVVALIYFLSPIDLISDAIPGLGYFDDAAVVAGCLLLVKTDLEDYRIWRKGKGYEFDDLPNYEEIEKEAKNGQWLSDKLFKRKPKDSE